jgi:putative two-component system response regulator
MPELHQEDLPEHVLLTAYVAELPEWDCRSHVQRIRRYVYIMARETGLQHEDARLISIASILHDVGKITLPVSLLRKVAHLEPAEHQLAERHTLEGARLLGGSRSAIIQAAEIIARTHHERWDGSGYPLGLKGQAVPLSGRIVGVADVFDALTTKRTYKTPMDPEAALDLVRSASGTLFDPELVTIFGRRCEDFIAILRTSNAAA